VYNLKPEGALSRKSKWTDRNNQIITIDCKKNMDKVVITYDVPGNPLFGQRYPLIPVVAE